jgi:hypothetical protein
MAASQGKARVLVLGGECSLLLFLLRLTVIARRFLKKKHDISALILCRKCGEADFVSVRRHETISESLTSSERK